MILKGPWVFHAIKAMKEIFLHWNLLIYEYTLDESRFRIVYVEAKINVTVV
jgi:hypothetical protein